MFSKLFGLNEELCCAIYACALGREFKQFKELKKFKEFKIGPNLDLKLFKLILNTLNFLNCPNRLSL